jgi:hypothetical protein
MFNPLAAEQRFSFLFLGCPFGFPRTPGELLLWIGTGQNFLKNFTGDFKGQYYYPSGFALSEPRRGGCLLKRARAQFWRNSSFFHFSILLGVAR